LIIIRIIGSVIGASRKGLCLRKKVGKSEGVSE